MEIKKYNCPIEAAPNEADEKQPINQTFIKWGLENTSKPQPNLLCMSLEHRDRVDWLPEVPESECRVLAGSDHEALSRMWTAVG